MTSAVFNIHPVGQASIICGYIGSDSVSSNYIVNLPIDWREEERMEVLYGDRISNQVKGFNYGTATVTIIIAVGGATLAEVAANARTLERAFSNVNGGFIEYKPVDYPDTVLHTYYHYLPAPPPRLIQGKAQTANDNVYGFGLEFQIPIQAWATSNPDAPVELVSATTIKNAQDATRDNYVIVPSTSLKGDIFFPNVQIAGAGATVDSIGKILVYKRGMRPGANTDLDWIEAEEMTSFGAGVVDAARSDGDYIAVSTTPDISDIKNSLGWDSSYAGALTPIIAARVAAGVATEWEATIHCASGTYIDQDSVLTVYVDNSNWQIYYQFPEVRFPNFRPQHHITDNSTPNFITYNANFGVQIEANLISGSENFHIDWILLAKASDFICLLEAVVSVVNLSNTATEHLEIDSLSGGLFFIDDTTNPDSSTPIWTAKGTPIPDLLFYKGEDSRLRFIGWRSGSDYRPDFEMSITVTGLHGTIYPFDIV